MEANNENQNEVHGTINGNFIILHYSVWDHEDENHKNIYVPMQFAINPDQVVAVQENKKNINKTTIYFSSRESQEVWESFEEIIELLDYFNGPKIKALLD